MTMPYTERRRINRERHCATRLGLHVSRDGATVRHGGLGRQLVLPTDGTSVEVTIGAVTRYAVIGLRGLAKVTGNGRVYLTVRAADGREILIDRPATDERLARLFASQFNTNHRSLVSLGYSL